MSDTVSQAIRLAAAADAPALSGVVFREFRGPEDYPQIAELINACSVHDGMTQFVSTEDLAADDARPVNGYDLYRDALYAEANDRIVGRAKVFWEKVEGDAYQYGPRGQVLPEWRRKGLGRILLRWGEGRLREIAQQHPAMAERYLQTFGAASDAGKDMLLRSEGYSVVRHFMEMERWLRDDLPTAALPEGLEMRPVLPQHYATAWDTLQEAFRDHWNYVPPSEGRYERWLAWPLFEPDLWCAAWEGDQMAGVSVNAINMKVYRKPFG